MLDRSLDQRQQHHRRDGVCAKPLRNVDAERKTLTHADLLNSKKGFDRLPSGDQRYHSTFHTSAVELGDLATRAKPKLVLLTHILFFGETTDEILGEARSRYAGPVVAGADLAVY